MDEVTVVMTESEREMALVMFKAAIAQIDFTLMTSEQRRAAESVLVHVRSLARKFEAAAPPPAVVN